jgi:hypothetical protein
MKRSEMVNIINRELRAQSSGNTDIDGDQLLSFIEAAGMQPPEYYDNPDNYSLHSDLSKWESEDESNS